MYKKNCHDLLMAGAACCDALFSSSSFRKGAMRAIEVLAEKIGARKVVLKVEGEKAIVFPRNGRSVRTSTLKDEGFQSFSAERNGVKATLAVEREDPLSEDERLLLSTMCKQLCIAYSGFCERQEAEESSRRMGTLYRAVGCLGNAMELYDLAREIARAAYNVVSPLMVRVRIIQGDERVDVTCPPQGTPIQDAKRSTFTVRDDDDVKCLLDVFSLPNQDLSRTDRRILRLLAEISLVFLENINLFQRLNALLADKERQISRLSTLYELGNAYRLTSNPTKRILLFLQGLTDPHLGLGFPVALYFSHQGQRVFCGEVGVLPRRGCSPWQGGRWEAINQDLSEMVVSGKVVSLEGVNLSLEGVTPPSMDDPFLLPREILPSGIGVPDEMRLMGVPLSARGGETDGFVVVGKEGAFSKDEIRILAMMGQQAALAIASAQSQSTIKELDREFKAAQARFMDAERMATLGELSARIAHDLKNPLIAIGGLARKLHGKIADDHPDKRYLEAIVKEVEEGERILSNVLGYVRKPVNVKRRVDINSILDELLFLFAEELRDRKVVLVKHLERGIPEVEVDPGQIRQVLTNLISNAIESMSSSEHGVLKVRSRQKRIGGKDWVCVEIEDTGGGIPEEVLPSIFKPFFSTKSRGTGLGLAIAKRIIEELHGGSIEVRNNPPQGATFVVSLPVFKKGHQDGPRGERT